MTLNYSQKFNPCGTWSSVYKKEKSTLEDNDYFGTLFNLDDAQCSLVVTGEIFGRQVYATVLSVGALHNCGVTIMTTSAITCIWIGET